MKRGFYIYKHNQWINTCYDTFAKFKGATKLISFVDNIQITIILLNQQPHGYDYPKFKWKNITLK